MGEHGTVSPADIRDYYINETFPISCYEDDDYYFVSWQVYDVNGNELKNYSDYITIDQPNNPLANVTICKTGTFISIKPKLLKRPKVLIATPVYEANGVFRDRTILVMFDKEIDRNSIYYDKNEIENLTQAGVTLLTDSERGNRCYGYINSDGEFFYKNIEIHHYSTQNENYLKYYGAPYLDKNRKNVLKIPVNKQNIPPSETDFLVTLKKGFCYKDFTEDAFVFLKNDFNFTYRTGNTMDNVVPSFGKYDDTEEDFVVRIVPEEKETSEYEQSWKKLLDSMEINPEPDYNSTEFATYRVNSKKFWVRGVVSDGGIGVSSVDWTITSMDGFSSKYPDLTPYFYSGNIKTVTMADVPNTEIDYLIDISNLNLKHGFYKLNIYAYDGCFNVGSFKELYFLFDDEAPEISSYEFYEYNYDYRFLWTVPSVCDLTSVEFSCGQSNYKPLIDPVRNKNGEYSINDSNETGHTFQELIPKVPNEPFFIELKATDFAGNSCCKKIPVVYYDDYVIISGKENGFIGYLIEDKLGLKIISEKTDTEGNLIINNKVIQKTSEVIAVPTDVNHGETKFEGIYLDDAFVIGQYPVTWDLYNAVVGTSYLPDEENADGIPGENPVTDINWFEAVVFCNKLSLLMGLEPYYKYQGEGDPDKWNIGDVPTSENSENLAEWEKLLIFSAQSGFGYRIPSWREWCFCAKGGNPRKQDWNYSYSGSDNLDEVAWYSENSNGKTHAVGSLKPNLLNLYDMNGNVWEFTNFQFDTIDVYGGSFNTNKDLIDSFPRSELETWEQQKDAGFRVVRNIY